MARTKPAEDLYAVLGVPRDADEKAVRRAYRRASTRCHPDTAGGSAEAFQRLLYAHTVLTDARRRADYDRTGEYDEPAPDNADAPALGIIGQMLIQVCADDFDVFTIDLRGQMVNAVNHRCDELRDEQAAMARQRVRAERLQKRFIRKRGGESVIAALLRSRALDLEKLEANRQDHLNHHERALAILAEYDFIVEAPQAGAAAKPNKFGPEMSMNEASDLIRRWGLDAKPPFGRFFTDFGT